MSDSFSYFNRKPNVSVITITFNRARYLVDAINSVVAQKYQQFEYIIIDDGSTDETEAVVAQYSDTRIRYYKLQRTGRLSVLRNYGVSKSTGEIVIFLDSDDVFDSRKIEKQVGYLVDNPNVGFTFSNCILWHSDGREVEDPFLGKENKKAIEEGWFSKYALSYRHPIHPSSNLMYKKSYYDEIGGYNENLPVGDQDFYVRLFFRTRGIFLNEYLTKIRVHAGNMNKDGNTKIVCFKEYLETLETLCKDGSIPFLKYLKLKSDCYYRIAHVYLSLDRTLANKYFFICFFVFPFKVNAIKSVLHIGRNVSLILLRK